MHNIQYFINSIQHTVVKLYNIVCEQNVLCFMSVIGGRAAPNCILRVQRAR